MFLRPFHVKSNSAVKASERKLLRQRINEVFPGLESSDIDTLAPSKCLLEVLRLVTGSGCEVYVTFVNKQPLFFECDDHFIPTASSVCSQLRQRRVSPDLMLPGIHKNESGEETMKILQKGEICAVGLVGNRSAVGVVKCLISWEDMQSCGMRGKGFKVLHLFGDKLWELGSLSSPPTMCSLAHPATPHCSTYDTAVEVSPSMCQRSSSETEHLSLLCERTDIYPTDVAGYEDSKEADCGKPMLMKVDDTKSDVPPCDDLRKAMDDLLKECFLKSLKTVMDQAKLPLLTSTFYSVFVCPQCPSYKRLDVKRSSFRKLSRFLHTMCEMGVIKVEETGKGVESITSINVEHPLVKEVSEALQTPVLSSDPTISAVPSSNKVDIISVTEFYTPPSKLLPVFHCFGHNKSSLLSAVQVEEALMTYVTQNKLNSTQKPSVVVLDPVLCDGLHHKSNFVCEELNWTDLLERVLKCMKQSHCIKRGVSETIVRKGPLPPVVMTTIQRTGNKKVTIVENLELYGVPAEKFAQTAQKTAAASATVETTHGSVKVLIQGIAVKISSKILQDQYGLSSKFIEVVDKLPKPTRKKGQRK